MSQFKCHEIEQGYLTRKPTLRIRKKDEAYIFTYKSKIKDAPKDLNVNDEVERPLTKEAYEKLRRKAVSEWLPSSGYELSDAPEVAIVHWFYEPENDAVNRSRYVELWLPIKKA